METIFTHKATPDELNTIIAAFASKTEEYYNRYLTEYRALSDIAELYAVRGDKVRNAEYVKKAKAAGGPDIDECI